MPINPENAPELEHSPDQMVIRLAESPEGKPCVGMTFGEEAWILLTTKRLPQAKDARLFLLDRYGVDTLFGTPIDWRESIGSNELKLIEEEDAIGVYVLADQFDSLTRKLVEL